MCANLATTVISPPILFHRIANNLAELSLLSSLQLSTGAVFYFARRVPGPYMRNLHACGCWSAAGCWALLPTCGDADAGLLLGCCGLPEAAGGLLEADGATSTMTSPGCPPCCCCCLTAASVISRWHLHMIQ